MAGMVYEKAMEFKRKYPSTIAWRIKSHSKVVESYLNPDEEVYYVFVGQKNDNPFDIITSYVFVLTNKRILLGTKRLLFGHFYKAITPDMFNDITVINGIFWGKIYIDTVKELVKISNLSKKALDEIETQITEYMLREKPKYLKADKS